MKSKYIECKLSEYIADHTVGMSSFGRAVGLSRNNIYRKCKFGAIIMTDGNEAVFYYPKRPNVTESLQIKGDEWLKS